MKCVECFLQNRKRNQRSPLSYTAVNFIITRHEYHTFSLRTCFPRKFTRIDAPYLHHIVGLQAEMGNQGTFGKVPP